jgi:hypothetical protein
MRDTSFQKTSCPSTSFCSSVSMSVIGIFCQLRSSRKIAGPYSDAYNFSVTRLLAVALLVLVTLGPANFAICKPSAKLEKITGRIVAYSSDLACLNGNGYWSMLIRVQDRKTATPRFVQVQFSLLCAEHPEWLDHEPSVQKFRLRRQQDADSVLKEFSDCPPDSANECPHLRMWRPVPGSEAEKLPFGHVVPSYRSADLPLAPVV